MCALKQTELPKNLQPIFTSGRRFKRHPLHVWNRIKTTAHYITDKIDIRRIFHHYKFVDKRGYVHSWLIIHYTTTVNTFFGQQIKLKLTFRS